MEKIFTYILSYTMLSLLLIIMTCVRAQDDMNSLTRALMTDDKSEIIRLINSGIPIAHRASALLSYAIDHNNIEMLQLLIARGANFCHHLGDKWTVLHSAAISKAITVDTLDFLLTYAINHNIDPCPIDNAGRTPVTLTQNSVIANRFLYAQILYNQLSPLSRRQQVNRTVNVNIQQQNSYQNMVMAGTLVVAGGSY